MTRPIVKKPGRGCKIFYLRFALRSPSLKSYFLTLVSGRVRQAIAPIAQLKTFFCLSTNHIIDLCHCFFCRRNRFVLISKASISTDFKCSACSLTSQMPFCSSFPPFVFSPCHWSRKNYSYQSLLKQRAIIFCLFLADVFQKTDGISLWLEHIIKD